jgi:hypothetical protein
MTNHFQDNLFNWKVCKFKNKKKDSVKMLIFFYK